MSTEDQSPDPARTAGSDAPAPRRRRRRAVGGVPPTHEADGTDEVIGSRSADDTDEGWGERPSPSDDEGDERYRREVPPHW